MSSGNHRWTKVILGTALLGGLAGYPLVNHTFGADREREDRIERERIDREARERHPKIHAAVEALRAAKEELNGASHDFGGHKREAIDSINRAITHLEAARDFDRK